MGQDQPPDVELLIREWLALHKEGTANGEISTLELGPVSWAQTSLPQAFTSFTFDSIDLRAGKPSREFRCGRCGSVLQKRSAYHGRGRNVGVTNSRYKCTNPKCGKWTNLKKILNEGLTLEDFRMASEWLRASFEQVGKDPKRSRPRSGPGVHGRVAKVLRKVPDGITLSKMLTGRVYRSNVVSIDKTYFGHEPNEMVYIEADDLWTHQRLHYVVAKCNDDRGGPQEAIVVRQFLDELKWVLRLNPKVAVVDLEVPLVSEIELAWPDIRIIGCYFHLLRRFNNKLLPTIQLDRDVKKMEDQGKKDPEILVSKEYKDAKAKLEHRNEVKELVKKIPCQEEEEWYKLIHKLQLLDQQECVDQLEKDRVHSAVEHFLLELMKGYYPPLGELRRMGLTSQQIDYKQGELAKEVRDVFPRELDKPVSGPSTGLLEEGMKDVSLLWSRKCGLEVQDFQGAINLLQFERRLQLLVGEHPEKYRFLGKACPQCENGIHENCEFREGPVWSASLGCCCGAILPMEKGTAKRLFEKPGKLHDIEAERAYRLFLESAEIRALNDGTRC